MTQHRANSGASERAWQEMTLTKVGRLGDVMQGATGDTGDGSGQLKRTKAP